jgi:hypothetical protein
MFDTVKGNDIPMFDGVILKNALLFDWPNIILQLLINPRSPYSESVIVSPANAAL